MAAVMGDLFGLDPFSDFRRMTRELANINPSLQVSEWRPSTDIIERQDYYEVDIDLPGVNKEEVNIELQPDGHLLINGRRQYQGTDKDRLVVAERPLGNFSRLLRVPRELSDEQIKASMNNGVLTIRLPKTKAGPKRIELREYVETKAEQPSAKGEVEHPAQVGPAKAGAEPAKTQGAKAEVYQQPQQQYQQPQQQQQKPQQQPEVHKQQQQWQQQEQQQQQGQPQQWRETGKGGEEQKGREAEQCPQPTHFPPTREEVSETGRCAEDIYRKEHPEEYNQPPWVEDQPPLPPFESRGAVTKPMFPEAEGQQQPAGRWEQLKQQQREEQPEAQSTEQQKLGEQSGKAQQRSA